MNRYPHLRFLQAWIEPTSKLAFFDAPISYSQPSTYLAAQLWCRVVLVLRPCEETFRAADHVTYGDDGSHARHQRRRTGRDTTRLYADRWSAAAVAATQQGTRADRDGGETHRGARFQRRQVQDD